MKRTPMFLAIFMMAFLLSGCFWKRAVGTNERGLWMSDGVEIDRVVSAGRYTKMSYYAEMPIVDCAVKTLEWTSPEDDLVTRDKQPIGVTIAVSYQRDCTSSSLVNMWANYNAEAVDDDALRALVLKRIPRVAKESTAQFTLDQMLGIADGEDSGRGVVTSGVFDLLEIELGEFYADLIDVGLNNINPSASYLTLLQQKADSQVAVEVAVEQTKLAEQELLREEKQTEVELELARRANLVNEERSKAFAQSPELLQLELAKISAEAIQNAGAIYFVPPGTDLSMWLAGQGDVPVPFEQGN